MSSPISLVIQLRPSDRNRELINRFGYGVNAKGAKFLAIYVHCGTSQEVAAEQIAEKNFTYQEALDFILEGDRSSVDEHTAYMDQNHRYRDNSGEKWEWNIPATDDTPTPREYGSVLMFTRTDDPNEEVEVLVWNEDEQDYELPE